MNGHDSQAFERTIPETGSNGNAARTLKGAKKQRAPQACESCRARKVRCNLNKQGIPCTNCIIDELQCVVGENRRKRRRTNNSDRRESADREVLIATESPASNPFAPSSYSVPLDTANSQPSIFNQGPLELHNNAQSNAAQPGAAIPIYIKQLPDRFGPDDVTYLRNKGALTIPERELRDELLSCYAAYVHPLMPLLDLQSFIQTIEHNNGENPVSLLLFQAVMFSGVATADANILKTAGYTHRREARRTFFNRTRLLYDLDYEDDSVALVQALLLMSFWREDPNARKETQHWIEIAVSLLQEAGLHREPEASGQLDTSQALGRRIWWSAYVRDVQIALGTRRPTLIHDVDFNREMLREADLKSNSSMDVSYLVRIPANQQALATACVEQTKLCICISHVLAMQYGVANSKGSRRTAKMLFGESSQPSHNSVQATDNKMREWHEKLPASVRVTLEGLQSGMNASDTCLLINCAALHMLYHAGCSCLHRLQLLSPSATKVPPHPTRSASSTDYLREALQHSATEITTTASALLDANLIRYLPSWTITVLLPAIIHHLSHALSLDHRIRTSSLQRYSICMDAMAALREMYAAADYSTAFLQAAIQRTEVGPLTQQEERKAFDALTTTTTATSSAMEHVPTMASDGMNASLSPRSRVSAAEQHGTLAPSWNGSVSSTGMTIGNGTHSSPNNPVIPADHSNSLAAASVAIDNHDHNHDGQHHGLPFGFAPGAVVHGGADFTLDDHNDDGDWFTSMGGAEDLAMTMTMMSGFEGDGTAL